VRVITAQDARNRTTWSRASSRRWLDVASDFTDVGERVAFDAVRSAVRNTPILDLGVGTGRTIPLLEPLTDEYQGIDYLPSMVEACHRRYPKARVDLGDARALTSVPTRHFGLVSFSFNGIDAVAHGDRRRVLGEMRRVMRDDGVVLFSTLNLHGPAFRERPWHPPVLRAPSRLTRVARTAKVWASIPFDVVRWAQLRKQQEHGPGWALAPLSAHHYGVLAHFTTLDRQLRELTQAGLGRNVVVIDNETGVTVTPGEPTSGSSWFHFIAHAS
jgi:SAM-dependent methyltransferase